MTTRELSSTPGIRRYTLIVVCLGVVMIAVDSTSVLLSLPQMKAELGLSETDLAWVLNGSLVAYAAFRLLSGRLGDLLGHRTLFLAGLVMCMVAALLGALSHSREQLITARVMQGVAGALVVTTALSLITSIFRDDAGRARAIAAYSFSTGGGASLGLLFGGTLTGALGWRWIFIVDLPIGCIIYVVCRALLPATDARGERDPLDLAGAATVTLALLVANYAILGSSGSGWSTPEASAFAVSVVTLLVLFFWIEARAPAPLVPLSIFRMRYLLTCCVTILLFSAAGSAAIFASLYLQLVLHYDPFRAGLAFLPLNLTMAVFALGPSARLVIRFGVRRPLAIGLLIMAVGLLLLSRTSVDGDILAGVLPGLGLLGLGSGVALAPLLKGAMDAAPQGGSGLVSGVLGTSSSIGRILGTAVLVSISAARTNELVTSGVAPTAALNIGYHLAFYLSATFAIAAAAFVLALLRVTR